MALSWNEIKDRALHFSKEWANTSNEEAVIEYENAIIRNAYSLCSEKNEFGHPYSLRPFINHL
jgi:hypothetical protein